LQPTIAIIVQPGDLFFLQTAIVQYNIHATLDVGSVTVYEESNLIVISFDVVLVNKTTQGVVWISTGMAYTVAGTEYIWISQCDITGNPADTAVRASVTLLSYTPFQLFRKNNFPLTGSASYDVGY